MGTTCGSVVQPHSCSMDAPASQPGFLWWAPTKRQRRGFPTPHPMGKRRVKVAGVTIAMFWKMYNCVLIFVENIKRKNKHLVFFQVLRVNVLHRCHVKLAPLQFLHTSKIAINQKDLQHSFQQALTFLSVYVAVLEGILESSCIQSEFLDP